MKKLAILGAGSWGGTLAWLNAGVNKDVVLWDRNPEKIEALKADRTMRFPVPLTLPDSLHLTSDLTEAITGADVIMVVVTSHGSRGVLRQMRDSGKLMANAILVNCSKGIEYPSLKRMSEVFAEELPDHAYAVLSGPSLAVEIIHGLPTACTLACADDELAEYLQIYLSHDRLLRLYTNTDVVGTELGGSLKNIVAIASGYMKQKQLGDNAQAALITRGLAEMTRFSVAQGADPKTLYGLSGLGDLLATCNSPLSRNYQVGAGLAQGKLLDTVLTDLKAVAEGVKTTRAVCEMGEKLGLDLPIAKMVALCLNGPFSEETIIKGLMSRKLKSEHAIPSAKA
ncbi:MAG: NAD(P)H-dependent glycerol-3-phosphate dehydrogenase [Candidatus Melainabacteria bacterium]